MIEFTRRIDIIDSTLALDLGTKTGWALLTKNIRGGEISSGCAQLNSSKKESADQRYDNFRKFLEYTIITNNVVNIYYEHVKSHKGTQAAHVYGGLLGILHMTRSRNAHIKLTPVGVGTIKKAFTGNGAASKDDMILKAQELGFHPKDDNEADALAILYFAHPDFFQKK